MLVLPQSTNFAALFSRREADLPHNFRARVAHDMRTTPPASELERDGNGQLDPETANVRSLQARLDAANDQLARAKAARLQAEADELEAEELVLQYRTQLTAAQQRLPAGHDLQPSIHRVPVDVWGAIFQCWLTAEYNLRSAHEDSDRCCGSWNDMKIPFLAASVCGAWRRAALWTAPLWTRVVFDFEVMSEDVRWLEYQNAHQARAGALPLSLHLVCGPQDVSVDVDPVWTHFRDTFIPRASSLEVSITHDDYNWLILDGLPLPCLETLCIARDGHGAEDPSIVLAPSAPRLRHLTMSKVFPSVGLPPRTAQPMHAVTSLDLSLEYQTVPEIAVLKDLFPALEHLHLTVKDLCVLPDTPIVWTGLKSLDISAHAVDPDELAVSFRLPDLETLAIDTTRGKPLEFWGRFVASACPAVSHLKVWASADPQKLVACMGAFSTLATLTLMHSPLRPELFTRLVQPDGEGKLPFRGLATLNCEGCYLPDDFDLDLFRDLIRIRREAFEDRRLAARLSVSCQFDNTLGLLGPHTEALNAKVAAKAAQVARWNGEVIGQ